ncbi:MAG: dihydropteroate synthase [Acidobacteria bacterium]|nr:dihydropteroate synthase [Acidobacteriota bacterium]
MAKSKTREWRLARRTLALGGRTLVMGVLNVTPDSFSDGGQFYDLARAVSRAEEMLSEGADIIDVGGESTRPGGEIVMAEEELRRIVPVVEGVLTRLPRALISVDTTKAEVARAALVADIHSEVTKSLRRSIELAVQCGVSRRSIAVDPGIGFGKSQEQNLELLAKLDELAAEFAEFPLLIGTSRKSFIGRLLDDAPVEERLHGTMATVTAAILGGADIIRVHDVRAAVETARVADAIRRVTNDERRAGTNSP